MANAPSVAALLGLSENASEAEIAKRAREVTEFYWTHRDGIGRAAVAAPTANGTAAVQEDAPRRAAVVRIARHPLFLTAVVLLAIAGGVLVARMDPLGLQSDGSTSATHGGKSVPLDTARLVMLADVADRDPSATGAMRELGDAYFVAGQWEAAVHWYTKLRVMEDQNVVVLANIGTASFNLGKREDARSLWLAGLALAPDDPSLHFDLGYYYLTATPPDYADARAEWLIVQARSPDSAIARAAQRRLDTIPAK